MDKHTVYKLAPFGPIPSLKIFGQWRFKKDLIDKWMRDQSLERTKEVKSFLKQKGAKENAK